MTIKEMRERRGKIAADMAELAKNLIPENIAKFDAMDKEQEDLRQQIERAERANELEAQLRTSRKPPEPPVDGGTDPEAAAKERKKREERYHTAWLSYMKHGLQPDHYGFRGVSEEDRAVLLPMKQTVSVEQRDMGTGGEGAYPGATVGSVDCCVLLTSLLLEIQALANQIGEIVTPSSHAE
jgi:HK97 family phage major capsid protein